MSDDASVAGFYRSLAEALFHYDPLDKNKLNTSSYFDRFVAQAMERELAGRTTFVDDEGNPLYLTRDNPHEGTEEGADLANYAMFTRLADLHAGHDDPEVLRLALTAATKSFEAHEAMQLLRKRLRDRS